MEDQFGCIFHFKWDVHQIEDERKNNGGRKARLGSSWPLGNGDLSTVTAEYHVS